MCRINTVYQLLPHHFSSSGSETKNRLLKVFALWWKILSKALLRWFRMKYFFFLWDISDILLICFFSDFVVLLTFIIFDVKQSCKLESLKLWYFISFILCMYLTCMFACISSSNLSNSWSLTKIYLRSLCINMIFNRFFLMFYFQKCLINKWKRPVNLRWFNILAKRYWPQWLEVTNAMGCLITNQTNWQYHWLHVQWVSMNAQAS